MIKNFKKLLTQFVAIQSVSADVVYESYIHKATKWLAAYAQKSGLQVNIIKGFGNPIVIARTKINPTLKTVLVYGHYDVQPALREDGWASDPFTLTSRHGRLFGRGAADNKGQILTHLYTVAALIKEKRLAYNVIFLIEGNEETGSSRFGAFLKKYQKELSCDCIMISDGDLATDNTPTLEVSFRGVANLEMSLSVAPDDLHSGLFGGRAPNASEVLSGLIAKFSDKEKMIFGGAGHSMEVTTLTAGYQGVGFRNSIPARAVCKVNIRSAGKSDPDELVKKFKTFVRKNIPAHTTLVVTQDASARGALLSLDNIYATQARQVLQSVYKKRVVISHCGATLPIITDFSATLKVPIVCVPLANTDCGMHSASENITLECIKKGLMFSGRFFSS